MPLGTPHLHIPLHGFLSTPSLVPVQLLPQQSYPALRPGSLLPLVSRSLSEGNLAGFYLLGTPFPSGPGGTMPFPIPSLRVHLLPRAEPQTLPIKEFQIQQATRQAPGRAGDPAGGAVHSGLHWPSHSLFCRWDTGATWELWPSPPLSVEQRLLLGMRPARWKAQPENESTRMQPCLKLH